jgi:hypothetical protein
MWALANPVCSCVAITAGFTPVLNAIVIDSETGRCGGAEARRAGNDFLARRLLT